MRVAAAAVVERREPATWTLAAQLLLRVCRAAPDATLATEGATWIQCTATAAAACVRSGYARPT
jgi:hypothetical protein